MFTDDDFRKANDHVWAPVYVPPDIENQNFRLPNLNSAGGLSYSVRLPVSGRREYNLRVKAPIACRGCKQPNFDWQCGCPSQQITPALLSGLSIAGGFTFNLIVLDTAEILGYVSQKHFFWRPWACGDDNCPG